MTFKFNSATAITFGAIAVTDVTMAINGTILAVIIIAVSSEVVATADTFFGLAF